MSLTALVFCFVFAVACMMAFARHPIYGLLAYIGVFYVHPPSRWWGQGLLLEVRWSLLAAAVTLVAVMTSKRLRDSSIPFFKQRVTIFFVLLIGWMVLQSVWVIDLPSQKELLTYYVKFLIAMYLIYRCVDSEVHLRYFMWAHVLGCFYLGWLAFVSHTGGRFEGFGGPGLAEANTGALVMVTAIVSAGSLFMASDWRMRVPLVGILAILVNAIVATVSRSGFLAFASAGLIFNVFTPLLFRSRVRNLSILGLVLFAILTNPIYWMRIDTIRHGGEDVEGVDTGAGRLDIIEAQLVMFQQNPLGCGHMCTTFRSGQFLGAEHLVQGGRASHNTFMTMLVDHGVVGGVVYSLMVAWVFLSLRSLRHAYRGRTGFLPTAFPAIAATLGAIVVSDMFAQYTKFEVRFWFIAIGMVLLNWAREQEQEQVLSTQRSR